MAITPGAFRCARADPMTDSSSIRFGSVTVPPEGPPPGLRPARSWPRRGPRTEQRWARGRSSLRPAPCVMAIVPEGFRCEVGWCRAGPRLSIDRAALPSPGSTRSELRQASMIIPLPAGPAYRFTAVCQLAQRCADSRGVSILTPCILPQSTWPSISQSREVVTASLLIKQARRSLAPDQRPHHRERLPRQGPCLTLPGSRHAIPRTSSGRPIECQPRRRAGAPCSEPGRPPATGTGYRRP
jgi:hypothetical protein